MQPEKALMHRLTLLMLLLAPVAVAQTAAIPASHVPERAPERAPETAPAVAPQAAPEKIDKPLPDIPTLMHLVETHQRADEALLKDYIYRSDSRFDETDKNGAIKKTRTATSEFFWSHGVQVRRTLKRDGKDLSPDELKKEDEKIDKEVGKAQQKRAKADDKGQETDSRGNEEITVSRMLELGAFTNPRRILVSGRPTIVIDFTGDPKAKTRNPAESAIHDMAGTLSVDEQDAEIQHVQGQFVRDFRIAGGLIASVSKGTSFQVTNNKINNEVWLPASLEAQGHARYLLFFSLEGNAQAHQYDYRKFKATSTILPGVQEVEDPQAKPPATPPSPPDAPK